MNLSVILDIAFGLILIYFILSLIASEIQEVFATLLQWRAKHLREAIANLLSGDLTDKLYQNPLIGSLSQAAKGKSKRGPSYVPSELFATALIEVLQNEIDLDNTDNLDDFMAKVRGSQLPDYIKQNLDALVKRAKPKVKTTEQHLQQLNREIASWFDYSMERASGVYKRNAKGVAFLIGLAIAIVANADTVRIVNSLSQESTLRSTVNQVADQVVAQNSEAISCLEATENRVQKSECLSAVREDVNFVLDNLSTLPFGWNLSEPLQNQFVPFNLKNTVEVLVGWLLSAVAISMGAPFWFELLNKVINVRNSGKKPKASTED
jgi:hypothetical protein